MVSKYLGVPQKNLLEKSPTVTEGHRLLWLYYREIGLLRAEEIVGLSGYGLTSIRKALKVEDSERWPPESQARYTACFGEVFPEADTELLSATKIRDKAQRAGVSIADILLPDRDSITARKKALALLCTNSKRNRQIQQ